MLLEQHPVREAQSLHTLWLCWEGATRRALFILFLPSGEWFPCWFTKALQFCTQNILQELCVSPPCTTWGAGGRSGSSGVGVGGLQWRVQFLTHLSALTLFYHTQASLYVWYFRIGRQLKSYNWVNIYVKVDCICICWTSRHFLSLTQIIFH